MRARRADLAADDRQGRADGAPQGAQTGHLLCEGLSLDVPRPFGANRSDSLTLARRKVMGDPVGKTFYGLKAGLGGLSVTKPTAAGSARRVPTLR